MAIDLIPFYGIASSTFGSLGIAWANLIQLREMSEPNYQWVVGVGIFFIFAGFILQSGFILGKIYTFDNILMQYGAAIIGTLIAFAIVWSLIRYRKY